VEKIIAPHTRKIQPAKLPHGFSLLELLAVISIIAILTAISLTQMRLDQRGQNAKNQLNAFIQLYKAAQSEAILTGRSLRLSINNNHTTLERHENTGWQPYTFNWQTDTVGFTRPNQVNLNPNKPIFFFASGQTSAFHLTLSNKIARFELSGDGLGQLSPITQ